MPVAAHPRQRADKKRQKALLQQAQRSFLSGQQALAILPAAMQWLGSRRQLSQYRESWETLLSSLPHAGGYNASDDQGDIVRRQMVGSTAVLPVIGVLEQKPSWYSRAGYGTSTEQLDTDIRDCLTDERVKSIVLFCDSPGGSAAGNEEVFRTILAARSAKPIIAYVKGLCCSACYYVASAALRIGASPSSSIGSIGTILIHQDWSKAYANFGVTPTVITYGINKGAGNSVEPLTPRTRGLLQKVADDYGGMFTTATSTGRNVSPETAAGPQFGQGSTFLASEALTRNLIDFVGDFSQFLQQLPQTTAAEVEQLAPSYPVPSESSPAAGASAACDNPVLPLAGTPPPAQGPEDIRMDRRLKAALFARGLITTIDASDDVCRAVLNAYFTGQGLAAALPDAEALTSLMGNGTTATAPAASAATSSVTAPASNVQQAHNQEMQEARSQVLPERRRIMDLQARGTLLGVAPEQVQAAIDGGLTVPAALETWTGVQASENTMRPVTPRQTVNVIGDQGGVFAADAIAGLMLKTQRQIAPTARNAKVESLGRAPLWVYARESLRFGNYQAVDEHDYEQICHDALAADAGLQVIRSEAGGPSNRPSSFPNILSALANKILDEGLDLADTTYSRWAGRRASDLKDFKTAPILNKQKHDQLDLLNDSEALKEFQLQEEILNYIQLDRYGNKFGWTAVMMANDDLEAFQENLLGFGVAHENTLNRLCLNTLTSNAVLLDNAPLFDTTVHKNDILAGSGGICSDNQWQAMLNVYYAQTGIGKKGFMRGKLDIALVPPQLERPAIQSFVKSFEVKEPTTDSTVNIYRGQVEPIIEAELQNYSLTQWYGMKRPKGSLDATVIYSYFQGFGENGKRERWYDPNTKNFYVSLEGRFGAAAKQYRTAVRNAGV